MKWNRFENIANGVEWWKYLILTKVLRVFNLITAFRLHLLIFDPPDNIFIKKSCFVLSVLVLLIDKIEMTSFTNRLHQKPHFLCILLSDICK